MKHELRVTILVTILGTVLGTVSFASGCVAQAGEACDGFFSNGCQSPATCVEGPQGAFCASSCSIRPGTEPGPRYYCEDERFEPVEVMGEAPAGGPSGPLPMGCHCFPKSPGEQSTPQ